VSTIAKADNEVVVSAASGWEMAIKNKSGKLDAEELLDRMEDILMEQGFLVLPISLDQRFGPDRWPYITRIPSIACLFARRAALA